MFALYDALKFVTRGLRGGSRKVGWKTRYHGVSQFLLRRGNLLEINTLENV